MSNRERTKGRIPTEYKILMAWAGLAPFITFWIGYWAGGAA